MTEADWRECTWPHLMLDYLEGKVSPRKWRLLACACCRGIWHQLTEPPVRQVVRVSERFAEGRADPAELVAAVAAAQGIRSILHEPALPLAAASAAVAAGEGQARVAVYHAAAAIAWEAVHPAWHVEPRRRLLPGACATPGWGLAAREAAGRVQADLVRDIFGNPFHPVAIAPEWLAWHDHTVLQLAYHIDTTADHATFPILADALEEAGCDDAELLAHCRTPARHVHGCWVLDALLGRN